MKTYKGFTLVEILMVVVLIGVVSAAAFLFLKGGIGAADAVSDRSMEETSVRLAASEIESLLENAAYPGDVFRIENPVLEASSSSFTFVSNTRNPAVSDLEDVITVASSDGALTVTDGNGLELVPPLRDADITFSFTDASGQTTVDPASVRTIGYTITLASGTECSGSSTPYNLELAGLSHEDYRDLYISYLGDSPKATQYKFEEDFETHPGYVFEDFMEGGFVWEPIITEDFESAASWANNWQTWLSDPGYGRVRHLNDASIAYEANSCLVLDCWKSGLSTDMGIWTVDISDYADTDLRLRYHWRETSDELDYADGVFLPSFTAGDTTVIDIEDFSDFRNGDNKGWTYWTNDYGRILVTSDYPTDGNYLNMDSRRNGGSNQCRVMNTYDLSSLASSENVWLRYDFADRNDENNSGDFIALMSGSIQGDPVSSEVSFNPQSFLDGSWTTRIIDLDELAPAGYDWSDFRIVFAQEDNDPTTSVTGIDGISIDNVQIVEEVAQSWSLDNRILQAPASFSAWEEAIIDLTAEAASAGVPFSNDFQIGFTATTREPYGADGILFDAISIDARNFGMEGWTHGVWPGYTEDEWIAVNNMADARNGSWYYSVGGTTSYNTTPTRAWLQSPDIDLTSFSTGDRVAFAFFHKYDFGNAGGGCNVLISDDNGATWDLIAPYFGYYTNSVTALGGQPGWTGQNYGWGTTGPDSYDFAVFDITDYAGETVQVRFNYATAGESHGGWQVDYARSRAGADWPQVDLNGGGFDWFAYSNSGYPDPSSTPDGSNWAGNDMSSSGAWDREYEDNQNNFLLSPPVCYDSDTGAGIYSYIEFIACPRTISLDYAILEVAAFTPVAPPSWHQIFAASGVGSGFEQFRYRIDWLPPNLVWTDNKTVVFRWRMLSNGDGNTHGGWNVDAIQCYTSDQDLPDVFNGGPAVVGVQPEQDSELRLVSPYEVYEPYTNHRPYASPAFALGPQKLLEEE